MEKLKPLSQVAKADPRSLCFAITDFKDAHGELSKIKLSRRVPEEVRSYFATVKNVCLYGRFVYPFYALAHLLTYLVIEFALRVRLESKEHRGRRSLRSLLGQAITLGLITDEGFSHVRRIQRERTRCSKMFQRFGHAVSVDMPTKYVEIIQSTLPNLRNSFAHPCYQPIDCPGTAFFAIRVAADFINQLFKDHHGVAATSTTGEPPSINDEDRSRRRRTR